VVKSYDELNEKHLDVLCELGNIGAGNAATALSVLLDEGVSIDVPQVMLLEYNDVIHMIGDPEELGIAIMIHYTGEVEGLVLFLLNYEDAKGIAEILIADIGEVHEEPGEKGFSDLKLSTIKEIGNIMGCSYLSSISMLTGLDLRLSIPSVSVDMVGAIMSVPMLEFSIGNSNIILIEGNLKTSSRNLKSHVLLFANVPSLNRILTELGIET